MRFPAFVWASFGFLFSTTLVIAQDGKARESPVSPDYSKEAFVIESFQTAIAFNEDGTGTREEATRVRIQSEAGVEKFGVITFDIVMKSDQFALLYARVRKPDGTTVETSSSGFQEVTPPVTREAPVYSDSREVQLPVKGLSSGDVLEYAARWRLVTPFAPGQFWTEYRLDSGPVVVLDRHLTISVPSVKYVQVSSPKLAPKVSEAQGRKTYSWSLPALTPGSDRKSDEDDAEDDPVLVRVTTFHDWNEVGQWYRTLAAPRAAVTPVIQAKADELTQSLKSDGDKQRAIYLYVGTAIRYISISFGVGRYEPHSAEEVLNNRYGDCKDKHTLLAALLKAAGYDAWPVLIGSGIKFDPDVPSPGQFNHVITAVSGRNGALTFLDATAGVASFAALMSPVRDQTGLVVPTTGAPKQAFLRKTPAELPYPLHEDFTVKGALSAQGVFEGHFDISMRDDAEFMLRAALRQVAPAQWQVFTQGLIRMIGFGGDVHGVNIENINDLDHPLRLTFDYRREDYSGWKSGSISPPLPMFSALTTGEKPKTPTGAADPYINRYSGEIKLPAGFTLSLEPDVNLRNSAGNYTSHYAIKDGVFIAERTLTVNKGAAAVQRWPDLKELSDAIVKDMAVTFPVSSASAERSEVALHSDPAAREQVLHAYEAIKQGRPIDAADSLSRAEKLNPQEPGLWAEYGWLHTTQGKYEQAAEDYRKEVARQPQNTALAWALLNIEERLSQNDEEIETLRGLIRADPHDRNAAPLLANLLLKKSPAEALDFADDWSKQSAEDSTLLFVKGQALLALGKTGAAVSVWKDYVSKDRTPERLNRVSVELAQGNLNLDLAKEYAAEALALSEAALNGLTIESFDKNAAAQSVNLAAAWDSLGWVMFRNNQTDQAKRYLEASWALGQDAKVADHLAQLDERLGERTEAAHLYRLALAADRKLEDAEMRLKRLAIPEPEEPRRPVHLRNGKISYTVPSKPLKYEEELGKLRTLPVSGVDATAGSAEFLVLASKDQVREVKFLSGKETLQAAGKVLKASGIGIKWPDESDGKIVRRGILSCSQYTTPHCNFTFYLPQNSAP